MGEEKQMEKTNDPLTFLCPSCRGNFEFDFIGEYQLVPCPICGIELMTIRKGQKMLLQTFEFNLINDTEEMLFQPKQVEVKKLES